MDHVRISVPRIPDDIPQIEEVLYRTWLQTYPNAQLGITMGDIEALFEDRESRIAKRTEHLFHLPENELFLVAKKNDRVIGLCRVIVRENYNQLQSIYILPEYQGQGVGTALWDEACKFIDPKKETVVQVATYNASAIAFYEKLGFSDTGKRLTEERHRMPISKVLVPEMELRRPAAADKP